MLYPVLVICDADLDYLERLYEQMIYLSKSNFTIRLFTKPEKLKEHIEDISVLLISDEFHDSELEKIPKNAYIILGSGPDSEYENKYYINKYSKISTILKQIMDIYSDTGNLTSHRKSKYGTEVISLYSPIRRCFQTTFAVTLGQILAKQSETLYINLETNSGFTKIHKNDYKYNFTDLVYLLKTSPEKISIKLDLMIEKINELEIIPPFENDIDLRQLNPDDICMVIEEIAKIGKYKYIVLDLSDSIQNVYQILDSSDKIFTIIANDRVALAKLDSFTRSIELVCNKNVLEKIIKIEVPLLQGIPHEFTKLLYSEMEGFVGRIYHKYFAE